MEILHTVTVIVQLISAIALIFIIAIQTTKSEQSGSGMGGWGTIGGQASSSISKFGLDAQLTRITTWIAVGFFVLSFVGALLEANIK
jgi:protein translocase SecG subunit